MVAHEARLRESAQPVAANKTRSSAQSYVKTAVFKVRQQFESVCVYPTKRLTHKNRSQRSGAIQCGSDVLPGGRCRGLSAISAVVRGCAGAPG